jgi:hypothetical protein
VVSTSNESFIFAGADVETTERQVFQAFYELEPNFAGRPIKDWTKGANPPDILCHDLEGKRIGVELTEWLKGSQMATEMAQRSLYDSYSGIIRSDCETPPRNVEHITVGLRTDVLPPEAEQGEFRRELFECIRQKDGTWPSSRSLQDHEQLEFPNHPILAKYVAGMKYWPCRPSERVAGIEWVRFPARGRFYTPREMFDELMARFGKKTGKYPTLRRDQSLDHLYLVVFYSKGLLWNPPYSGAGWGFRDIVSAAGQLVSESPGPFQKIFLFSPAESGQKVLQVWPESFA